MTLSKARLAGSGGGQPDGMPGPGVLCNSSSEVWGCCRRGLRGARDPALTCPRLGPGWLYGERLRDGDMGWFPEEFARSITNRVAVEGNVRRMERLRVETDV